MNRESKMFFDHVLSCVSCGINHETTFWNKLCIVKPLNFATDSISLILQVMKIREIKFQICEFTYF